MAKLPDIMQTARPIPSAGGVATIPDLKIGAGTAVAGVGRTLGAVSDFLYKEQQKDDVLRAEDAFNQLRNRQLDLTTGQDGFANLKSGDAVNRPIMQEYGKKFEQSIASISNNLANDHQRELFKRRAAVSTLQFKQDLLNHITKQKNVYAQQVFEGGIKTEMANAAARWQDPNSVKLSQERINALIKQEADRSGWAPEKLKLVQSQATTDIHSAVIQQALATDHPDYAQQYYDAYKKEIMGTSRAKIEALIGHSTLKIFSQNAADEIFAKNMSQSDALAYVRKKYSGDKEDAIISRIKTLYGEQTQIREQEQRTAGDSAWKIYAETRSFDKIPVATLQQMDGKERENLRRYAQTEAAGGTVKTNFAQYYDLRKMASEDPNAFRKQNLRRYQLGPAEFKELVKLQTDDKGLSIARTKTQIMSQGAAEIGLDPREATKDSSAGEKVRSFYKRIDQEAEDFQKIHGKPPTEKDIADIVNRLSIQVIKERWYWNKKTAAGLAKIDGVPDNMIDDLARAVQSAGQPVTEANIKKLYMYMTRKP